MQDSLLNEVQLTRKKNLGQLYLEKESSRETAGSVAKMEDDDMRLAG